MKGIGSFLFFTGLISTVLYFIGMELVILVWIDLWGPTIGWIIRGGLMVAGGLMWLFGSPSND